MNSTPYTIPSTSDPSRKEEEGANKVAIHSNRKKNLTCCFFPTFSAHSAAPPAVVDSVVVLVVVAVVVVVDGVAPAKPKSMISSHFHSGIGPMHGASESKGDDRRTNGTSNTIPYTYTSRNSNDESSQPAILSSKAFTFPFKAVHTVF